MMANRDKNRHRSQGHPIRPHGCLPLRLQGRALRADGQATEQRCSQGRRLEGLLEGFLEGCLEGFEGCSGFERDKVRLAGEICHIVSVLGVPV